MQLKRFKVADLGLVVSHATPYHATNLEILDRPTPTTVKYVSRSGLNNSIVGYVEVERGFKVEAPNAITVGQTTATVAYQDSPFICGTAIDVYRAPWLTQNIGLYLVTYLRHEHYRYCYGRAMLPKSVFNTTILLPVTDDGDPDWEAVESFMGKFVTSVTNELSEVFNGFWSPQHA